ncbi:MAG: hypothetical protein K6C05_09065 [Anaerovibrio sp.]|uniref:hypothetical protein n=1 Tax=Anaerovibrio sp. TaxID=1872532 RepID=UPI0025F4A625|nr:hypothetical protein [Anaerovibrio sp.]MCR5176982.1 hypothetical protein [Anaerovibrio sp.]
MLEKVARVARVKGVDCDVNSPFLRKNSSDDQYNGKSPFHRMLVEKMKEQEGEVKIQDAYVLDCQKVTHSLFYQNGVDLNFFGGGMG